MKLRNKQTGEITEANDWNIIQEYNSLAELNEEWEDYEEQTGYWYIDFDGDILGCAEDFSTETDEKRKEIGNYFETKEEAEKSVKKLKAWKRLKDNGFVFEFWTSSYSGDNIDFFIDWVNADSKKEIEDDLDLLFGDEE